LYFGFITRHLDSGKFGRNWPNTIVKAILVNALKTMYSGIVHPKINLADFG